MSFNKRVGSIERVGDDGFIVRSRDHEDSNYHEGVRLFATVDELMTFLKESLDLDRPTGRQSTDLTLDSSVKPGEKKPLSLFLDGPKK